MSHPIHHLDLSISGCLAEVRLNGFTLLRRDATRGVTMAPPINQLLVGAGNRLVVEALPLVPDSDTPARLRHVTLGGAVRAYQRGQTVTPGVDGGEVVRAILLPPDLVERDRQDDILLPVTLAFEFDTAGPSFADRLLEARPFEDEAGLLDYALRLRDLLAAARVADLTAEFAPKLADFARAYDEADPALGFPAFLRDRLLPAGPVVAFDRDALAVTPTCGGRLWEVHKMTGEPLIVTALDARGGRLSLPVYVGRVDGALKVVR